VRIPKDTRALSGPERRRRKILDAALELIGEGGPDAITHRAVAERAQVALGSTTYHYRSRNELLRAAFRHYLTEATAILTAAAADARSPRATIDDVAELAAEAARRGANDARLVRPEYELILSTPGDPELARDFLAYERALESGLAVVLERLGVARPNDAARTVIDMVRGFELERFARPKADPKDLRRRVRSLVEALAAPGRGSRVGKGTRTRRTG